MKRTFALFLLLLACAAARADGGVVDVRHSLTDRRGTIWHATAGHGLVRRQGNEAVAFRPHHADTLRPAAADDVYCMSEDGRGGMWFGTVSGLYHVDGGGRMCELDTALRRETVHAVAAMDDGTVWAGLRGRLLHMTAKGRLLQEHELRDSLGHPLVVPCMLQNHRGDLVGCLSWNVGLFTVRGDSLRILPWGMAGSPQWMVSDPENDCYWVATWGAGVVRYGADGPQRSPLFPDSLAERARIAYHIDRGADGQLLVKGGDGHHLYSTRGGRLATMGEPFVRTELPDKRWVPQHITRAQDGLWMRIDKQGTARMQPDGTLEFFPRDIDRWPKLGAIIAADTLHPGVWTHESKTLVRVTADSVQRLVFLGHDVLAMHSDGHSVWADTYGGLMCYDIASGTLAECPASSNLPISQSPTRPVRWTLENQYATCTDTLTGRTHTIWCSNEAIGLECLTDILVCGDEVTLAGPGAVVSVNAAASLDVMPERIATPPAFVPPTPRSHVADWVCLIMAVLIVISVESRPLAPIMQKLVREQRADTEFLTRAHEVVDEHLADEKYEIEDFARDLGLSRSQLFRKLAAESGEKPREFIRNHRLARAAEMLKEGRLTVAEIAFRTGFNYASHFSRRFKDRYGVSPTQYV